MWFCSALQKMHTHLGCYLLNNSQTKPQLARVISCHKNAKVSKIVMLFYVKNSSSSQYQQETFWKAASDAFTAAIAACSAS